MNNVGYAHSLLHKIYDKCELCHAQSAKTAQQP
jgi:hypothetical protein